MTEEFSVKLRLPREISENEVIEIKAKIKHPSSTGLQLVQTAENRYERFVRSAPAVYVRTVEVLYGGKKLCQPASLLHSTMLECIVPRIQIDEQI